MNIKKWLKGKRRRWSGHDRHFGPITLSDRSSAERYYGIVLDSGDDEDTCHLRIYLGTRTLLLELPPLVEKYRKWVDTSHYDWGKPGGGYWEVHSREFGIQCGSEGFVQVFLGPQTHDSRTTKSWCTHLPWTQWRHVRFSLYDTAGSHFWTQLEKDRPQGRDEAARRLAGQWSDARWEAEKACPKVAFRCVDYDGAEIIATTHIEEREWKRGEKWCSWLSLFYRPMIRRSLDIHYSAEVGPRKGSWKGGTVGTGINMLPGELHDDAFIRHCVKEGLTYMGPLPNLADLATA
jgi:hypothetical protein